MKSLTVFSYQDIASMAAAIFEGRMYKVKTPQQAIGMMLIAQAEGRHPVEGFMRYHIMEDGRPSKKAEVALSDFMDMGGKCVWLSHESDRTEQKAQWTYEGVSREIGFRYDDAVAAGYVKAGSNWTKDIAAQLRARCITRALRMVCPKALGGLRTPEELADIPADEECTVPASWAPVAAAAASSPTLPAPEATTAPAAAPTAAPAAVPSEASIADLCGQDGPAALAYLVTLGWIKPGQGFDALNQGHQANIRKRLPQFLAAARKAYTAKEGK